MLIVEEDNLTGGWGAEVAARLGREVFYYLDAPITRVAPPDTPVPAAAALEKVYVPAIERIVAAVHLLLEGG
jgi:pyruvate/2-oxoglutarate/acetoin dehydrogenase E1 component